MSLGFTSGEARHEERVLHGEATELENAVVAFFWEGEKPRMGPLTVTLPDRSSSSLLGDRDRQLGMILGAQLSALTGKMALVSVNLYLLAQSDRLRAPSPKHSIASVCTEHTALLSE